MGVIILTSDDSDFMSENPIVMDSVMKYPPTAPNRTYILRSPYRFTEADILEWWPLVSYRLVVVVKKLPTLTSKSEPAVIIHPSLSRSNRSFYRNAVAMLRWDSRERAKPQIEAIPLPLAHAFIKRNKPDDIVLHRRLVDVAMTLPDSYAHAILTYGLRVDRGKVEWPQKKKVAVYPPQPFRASDRHWKIIVENSAKVANQIRDRDLKSLPDGVKKKKEGVQNWL